MEHKLHIIRLIKYLISGCTAAAVNIGFLYLFTDIFNIHYLISGVLAFILAFGVSFTLQKFWTFQNHSRQLLGRQLAIYLIVSVSSLVINTLLLYLLVDWFGVWYILAQIIAGGLLAVVNFFIYRFVIFHPATAGQVQPLIETEKIL